MEVQGCEGTFKQTPPSLLREDVPPCLCRARAVGCGLRAGAQRVSRAAARVQSVNGVQMCAGVKGGDVEAGSRHLLAPAGRAFTVLLCY